MRGTLRKIMQSKCLLLLKHVQKNSLQIQFEHLNNGSRHKNKQKKKKLTSLVETCGDVFMNECVFDTNFTAVQS